MILCARVGTSEAFYLKHLRREIFIVRAGRGKEAPYTSVSTVALCCCVSVVTTNYIM